MVSPGTLLSGRYRLDERIATGGMGDVWRGTDETLGRTVAIKILLPALLEEPGFSERFRLEARTMATINHPGVVDIYDYGSDQQVAYLVMEYVEGDALSRTLARVGRLTPARTMALIAQAAEALEAAHLKGIVHRDVKPGNLLVRANGTLVLTDFGIARSAVASQLTAAGAVLGTASYLAPEQAAGQTATTASDIYSLGVVAYQCLSGRRPFDGDNPIEIAMKHVRMTPPALPPDVPPAVRAIVERAMAKDPSARWPSAAIFAAASRQAAAVLSSEQSGRAASPSAPVSPVPYSPAPSSPARPPVRPVTGSPAGTPVGAGLPHRVPGQPAQPVRPAARVSVPAAPAPVSPLGATGVATGGRTSTGYAATQAPSSGGWRTFWMILLVFLAMAAIVAIAAFIGYTVTRNTTASGAAHTSTVANVTRQANIWQADSARANLAETSAATAVRAIATDTAGSRVLAPTSEGRRTR
ncbi:MAG: protein kinase [Hamadaea sp.]|uniref:serine/threonine-protein kinase n=1 Tax=Hamadaea sp. NPDC050747 TaxID=3155789 RepID=UPI0017D6B6AB|nr:protein kinase [Hamadaea sp.]NUT05203.1 protein kinase [Hamadaea sp.]